MTSHDTFLRLAATAVDEHLGPPERARLEQHVTGCPSCAHAAAGYRSDAIAIAALPPAILPERRGAEILATVLAPPSRGLSPARLVLVVALLLLALAGSLWAGSELLSRWNGDLAVVVPVPSEAVLPTLAPPATPDPKAAYPVYDLVVTQSLDPGDGSSEDWVALLDPRPTGPPRRLLAQGRDPAWLSTDRIVYTCDNAAAETAAVCVVDVDVPGSPETLLADGSRPVPAPDGSAIAVSRGEIDTGETWIMAPDGSNVRRLTAGVFDRWSPDGAWLAGQPETSGSLEVAIIGADGEGLRVIGSGYDPAWSPSGDRLAYAAVGGETASIHVVDLATGEDSVRYTAESGTELAAPVLLADGGLAFILGGDLQILASGASDTLAITSDLEMIGSSVGELAPSPDGEWLAYTLSTEAVAQVSISSARADMGIYFPDVTRISQPRWAPGPRPRPVESGAPEASASLAGGDPLGSTWETATVPMVVNRPVGRIESVTAGGPGFVAVGRGCLMEEGGDVASCEGIAWISTDGRTWERSPASAATDLGVYLPTSGPEFGMFDVAAGGPGIVAIGYAARPDMAATIWFSGDDGASWKRVKIGDAGSTRVNAITWDGARFIMVGEDRSAWDGTLEGMAGATARAAVWTSTDGSTFTRVPHTAALDVGEFIDTMEDPSTGGMSDVATGPGGLVAVGSVCTADPGAWDPGPCAPMAWTSTDGSSWEQAAEMLASDDEAVVDAGITAVAASDDRYVAAGGNWVLTSTDGRTWARSSYNEGGVGRLAIVGDRFFALTGYGLTVSPGADGTSWQGVQVVPWLPGKEVEPVDWHFAATRDIAVAVGNSYETDELRAMVSVGQ